MGPEGPQWSRCFVPSCAKRIAYCTPYESSGTLPQVQLRARHVLHVPERPVKGSAVRTPLCVGAHRRRTAVPINIPASLPAFLSFLFLHPGKPATLRVSGPSSSKRRFSSQELYSASICNIHFTNFNEERLNLLRFFFGFRYVKTQIFSKR